MAPVKPVILTVDDDVPVLRADRARPASALRQGVPGGGRRRPGAEALEAVRQLTLRGSVISLFVIDQRMPSMTGIEFLAQAIELQPDAKRVLLTAYADTDVAIKAINEIRLDHYILKPWDPPEERLYPVTDDLLADWTSTFRPAFEGLRLLAGRWAPGGHVIRDYLTRNQVPYQWIDPEEDEEGRRLAASLVAAHRHGADRGLGADRHLPGRQRPARPGRPATSPSGSGCRRGPRCRSTTWSSWAAARPVWRRRSTARARASRRS